MNDPKSSSTGRTTLKRGLTLPLLTLYGLGVTIGAGIYVLVGATAAKAGIYAPVSFLLAAVVVGFTSFSYCELATRYPVSAGEAAYVRAGFKSSALSLLVGLIVVSSAVVSAAAISLGTAGYLQAFVPLPADAVTLLVIVIVFLIAVWGIVESVGLAAILTLLEIAGLALVIVFGLSSGAENLDSIADFVPPLETDAWYGVFSAGLLAFFAFVGFEDMANVAEEVKNPRKNMPRGIILTLVITTIIYFMVVAVVIHAVPLDTLVTSSAPLALIFAGTGSTISGMFSSIAIIATFNGALIQIIMASRVVYGLASQGNLPSALAYVNPLTRTPLTATALIVVIVFVLAFFAPIADLAEVTSMLVLMVFCFVNIALIRLKRSPGEDTGDHFNVPLWVPVLGLVSSIFLFFAGVFPG
jgi:amino acid transporter